MYLIDDQLKEFLEAGVGVVVGSADREGRPHLSYAWGPRVNDNRTSVSVFIEAVRAERTLRDVEQTGLLAVTFGHPVSYRSVQLKGRVRGTCAASPEEEQWVARHRDAFGTTTALVGDPPQTIRNLWMQGELVRVDMDVERAFDQTPGPDAGRPL